MFSVQYINKTETEIDALWGNRVFGSSHFTLYKISQFGGVLRLILKMLNVPLA